MYMRLVGSSSSHMRVIPRPSLHSILQQSSLEPSRLDWPMPVPWRTWRLATQARLSKISTVLFGLTQACQLQLVRAMVQQHCRWHWMATIAMLMFDSTCSCIRASPVAIMLQQQLPQLPLTHLAAHSSGRKASLCSFSVTSWCCIAGSAHSTWAMASRPHKTLRLLSSWPNRLPRCCSRLDDAADRLERVL